MATRGIDMTTMLDQERLGRRPGPIRLETPATVEVSPHALAHAGVVQESERCAHRVVAASSRARGDERVTGGSRAARPC